MEAASCGCLGIQCPLQALFLLSACNCRGFEEDCDKIQINTDCRSRKIEELKHCPFAEICWYFTDSWEQFRINGTIETIDGSNPDPRKLQQREKCWFASSLNSRLQYLGPNPGLPRLNEEPPKEVILDRSIGPVGAFCVLVLDPEQVDYLNLKSNQRLVFTSTHATVGYNGRPSNRTLIFRGFQGDTDKIQIHTDSTSRKIDELKHCPFAEICWYFTESWEQFRIKGRIDIVDGSNPDPVNLQTMSVDFTFDPVWDVEMKSIDEREKSWFARSPRSRLLYLDPGHPLVDEESPKEVSIDPSAGPVDAFCLLVHDPEQVDYLNLKSNQRLTFTSRHKVNGDKWWTSEKINP
ncbi:hypothetical protein FEM48_Zijuj08G0038600 [Ziziphus jujuba var. spinosa]|uniref:pyridoxal 5'-phosphate synthase n=1 Tax=Ziziphus jujuba var. spinosa TaxID=714518 RepID=A0A978UWU5_ZIZJJ|nr:hypothetical protein FEM48_Zijuj08G0038600 [Ziziphus jujuba var. spinosa]